MTVPGEQLRIASRQRKLIVVGILAILVGNLTFHVVREQLLAIKISRLGGAIERRCGMVHGVRFEAGSPFSDADLPTLSSFRDLRELDLTLTKVTSAGVARLRICPRLSFVELRKDQVSKEQEHEMLLGDHPIEIAKYTLSPDGIRVGDGYE